MKVKMEPSLKDLDKKAIKSIGSSNKRLMGRKICIPGKKRRWESDRARLLSLTGKVKKGSKAPLKKIKKKVWLRIVLSKTQDSSMKLGITKVH